jgi:hypothetical protein
MTVLASPSIKNYGGEVYPKDPALKFIRVPPPLIAASIFRLIWAEFEKGGLSLYSLFECQNLIVQTVSSTPRGEPKPFDFLLLKLQEPFSAFVLFENTPFR